MGWTMHPERQNNILHTQAEAKTQNLQAVKAYMYEIIGWRRGMDLNKSDIATILEYTGTPESSWSIVIAHSPDNEKILTIARRKTHLDKIPAPWVYSLRNRNKEKIDETNNRDISHYMNTSRQRDNDIQHMIDTFSLTPKKLQHWTLSAMYEHIKNLEFKADAFIVDYEASLCIPDYESEFRSSEEYSSAERSLPYYKAIINLIKSYRASIVAEAHDGFYDGVDYLDLPWQRS